MLRRKLLIMLSSVTALLMVLALVAVWLVQSVFADVDHINHVARGIVDWSAELSVTMSTVELELQQLRGGEKKHLDGLIEAVGRMNALVREGGQDLVGREPEVAGAYAPMVEQLAAFTAHVGALATTEDPALAQRHQAATLLAAAGLRDDTVRLARQANAHWEKEQTALTVRLRWLAIGMAVGFLVVINLSIFLLLRSANMILGPMEKLVEASRQLAQERFDYRVSLGQNDEFDDLARAFNQLAQQLQDNERRKLEMLGQTAVTLNHELNNALAIIELQLRLLQRQLGPNPEFEKCLRQIRENLQRTAQVVESLKHLRRIVLTDYVAGQKMLDLRRSVEEEAVG